MCVGKAGLGEWPPRGLRQAVCRTLRVFSTSCTSTLANWQGILGKLMLKLTRMALYASAPECMQSHETEVWSTDCPLAAIQFKQHAGVKPMHPMSILASAYRENGFQKALVTTTKSKEE